MGFFKKIGKALKGVTKAVSLKNAIKLAHGEYQGVVKEVTGRVVKGVKGAVDSEIKQGVKKLTTSKNTQIKQQAVQYQKELDDAQGSLIKTQQVTSKIRQNPNFGDIMQGALGGALTGAGGVLAGSDKAGEAGATLVDNTMGTWFKANWWKVAIGVVSATLLVIGIVRMTRGGTRTRR